MTISEIYSQAKELSNDDRGELCSMLLEDMSPEPANIVRSRKQLIQLLRVGMIGDLHRVTDATWERRHRRILRPG